MKCVSSVQGDEWLDEMPSTSGLPFAAPLFVELLCKKRGMKTRFRELMGERERERERERETGEGVDEICTCGWNVSFEVVRSVGGCECNM